MLAIKLQRIGKKGQASFRVVVKEKRSKMVGRFTDDLGWFNPHTNQIEINKERAMHWIKIGAQATDTVHNLFVRKGIIRGKKIAVHGKKKGEEIAPVSPAPSVTVAQVPEIKSEETIA